MKEPNHHQPVLYQEIIHALRPIRAGVYVDCTVGAGGHAWGILQASKPDGCLLGLDVDPQAIELAQEKLITYRSRAILVQASYTTLREQLDALGWTTVDGILLDLGLSSMQLDMPERGFSFRLDAPLDMRFDPHNTVRAADLVNTLSESELANLLFKYGEERRSRKIARAIIESRPVNTTHQLAKVVARVVKGRRRKIHPATRTFQALRIAVNRELDALETVLPQTIVSLAPGGRLGVIAYQSLEDRIVKQFFRQASIECICPPKQPVCSCRHQATLSVITRRPIRPQDKEIQQNPRARSARLRIAERLPPT